jgi:mRNA interferase MazF
MKEGDIILVPVPQSDGQTKRRPAVLLRIMPSYGDFLVCGISTQLRQQVAGFDDVVRKSDPNFIISGLHEDSLIRLGFLAVFTRNQAIGAIGEISPKRHQELLKNLADHLTNRKPQ